jgi:transposase
MRKPPFKHGRANSRLAQHAQASRCCTKRAIIVAAHAICLPGSPWLMARSTEPAESRKCFVDFQAFVQQAIIPEALRRQVHTVTFILDNGTTHAPKQLESWLCEQEQACEGRLHFQVHWLPPNASWLDQIEIWFSVLQRKHLQPNHFPSTHALETSLSEYITYYNQTAKPINWTYTVEKLEQKVGAHL